MLDEILQHHTGNRLHHAYLIVGSAEAARPELERVIETILGAPIVNHADYHAQHAEVFAIEESRLLREAQSYRAIGERRCFFVSAQSFTEPAEQALLKTLEDSIPGNHFFVLTPSLEALRPTVRSRCYIIELEQVTGRAVEAGKFLAASVPERFKLLEKLLPKKTATAEEKRKLKRELAEFCDSLEVALHEKHPVTSATLGMYDSLSRVRSYLGDSGAAVRILAEHLALVLPTK